MVIAEFLVDLYLLFVASAIALGGLFPYACHGLRIVSSHLVDVNLRESWGLFPGDDLPLLILRARRCYQLGIISASFHGPWLMWGLKSQLPNRAVDPRPSHLNQTVISIRSYCAFHFHSLISFLISAHILV